MKIFEQLRNNKGTVSSALGKKLAQKALEGDADILKEAYLALSGEFTDDAAVVERAGYKVKLYRGDYRNIKITTPQDLLLAEMMAGN